MKKNIVIIAFMAAIIMIGCPAMAINIDALDKVNILMPKADVKALIGEPDSEGDLILGLDAEVYHVKDITPMIGVGCIYDNNDLVGLAYMFEGSSAVEAVERMKSLGFANYKTNSGVNRLVGKDDDTGEPIVVVILEEGGLTSVITFEKTYYEKTLKEKKAE